ncbi:MAG: isoprenylcysteine carboxylmethyltransferase family protein [Candidatus Zixiibacteriota bacterium]|nr:MAG: isoprenylcysteine carboxylmethyltransferase family protein [candidate division Zixibacteria bacterium]
MDIQSKVIVFLVVSVGFVWLSRRSLRNIRAHGFYRFFAFESILALILLNLDCWFDAPLSGRQVISWLLLAASGALVFYSFLVLRRMGRPGRERDDPSLTGVERTTRLVTRGPYRYIRHPIYSAGVIGTWGVFFKQPSWASSCLAVIVTIFFTMTARVEEAENIHFFGDEYRDYMKKTRMFIPFLF